MAVAYGHTLYDQLPAGSYLVKWAWDPVVLVFVVLCFFYWRGLRHFKAGSPIATWQKVCFFAGIIVNGVALLPPIDPLSDQLFSAHMLQHMMITQIGVPLIIFGSPFFVMIRGLSPWFRRQVYFPVVRSRPARSAWAFLSTPVVALLLFQLNFGLWHVPLLYNLSLLNDWFHLLQHATFAFTAVLLWRNIIDPYPMVAPLPLPARLLFVGSVMVTSVILAAILTFSSELWYAYEGRPLPSWWSWSRMEDQRLGGLIMWVPGEFLDLAAMTVVFFTWVSRENKKDRDQQRQQAKAAEERSSDAALVEPAMI